MKLQNKTKLSHHDLSANAHGRWYGDACGAAFAMELVGERWTLLIVRELMLGGRRFSDIRASLPAISAKVLTERLERLETVGVLVRRKLAPPAPAQLYELTNWGYALEPAMQALGRWSVRSPLHDPTLPISPVSFMLSLRTMYFVNDAGGMTMTVLFEVGGERLVARLLGGELTVARAGDDTGPFDITFSAPTVNALLGVFYGKRTVAECGVTIADDSGMAARFTDLFRLPPKAAPPSLS